MQWHYHYELQISMAVLWTTKPQQLTCYIVFSVDQNTYLYNSIMQIRMFSRLQIHRYVGRNEIVNRWRSVEKQKLMWDIQFVDLLVISIWDYLLQWLYGYGDARYLYVR